MKTPTRIGAGAWLIQVGMNSDERVRRRANWSGGVVDDIDHVAPPFVVNEPEV